MSLVTDKLLLPFEKTNLLRYICCFSPFHISYAYVVVHVVHVFAPLGCSVNRKFRDSVCCVSQWNVFYSVFMKYAFFFRLRLIYYLVKNIMCCLQKAVFVCILPTYIKTTRPDLEKFGMLFVYDARMNGFWSKFTTDLFRNTCILMDIDYILCLIRNYKWTIWQKHHNMYFPAGSWFMSSSWFFFIFGFRTVLKS